MCHSFNIINVHISRSSPVKYHFLIKILYEKHTLVYRVSYEIKTTVRADSAVAVISQVQTFQHNRHADLSVLAFHNKNVDVWHPVHRTGSDLLLFLLADMKKIESV